MPTWSDRSACRWPRPDPIRFIWWRATAAAQSANTIQPMQAAPVEFSDTKRNLWVVPAALIAGAALGLFVNGYWLSAALPPASRQLLLLTALAALAGAAVYWRLLLWAGPRLAALPGTTRLSLAFVSLAAGVLLFFAGTAQWLGGGRYISFLLPAHRLTVQADAAAAPGSVALAWFTTSVGDVSYGALDV